MKNIKYIALVLLVLISTSSCKKFLDVNPKTEMERSVLFANESGFRDALAGVYIQLKDDKSYGKAMTMTTMEHLVSSWDVTTNTTPQRLGLFNYGDAGVESALADIYGQQYKIIASINAILEQIDAKKDVFSPGMYEMIKGECLALRAYCHFDLLRLFGPVPTSPGMGNQLHYVQLVSKKTTLAISYEAFKTALLKDLADAEALEKDVDPFTKYSILDFKNGIYKPENDFVSYRYLRMNYYAVKALQARAYLWFNDQQKAYECAKVLIDAKNTNATPKFRLGVSSDMATGDYVLTCEHIFGIYDFAMYTKYNSTFGPNFLKKGASSASIGTELYGNTGTDIRESNLWEQVVVSSINGYILKKYKVVEGNTTLVLDFKQIPMLRISEMYLIAIETAAPTEAQSLWTAFRLARNINNTTLPADHALLQLELLKEYRKEFYGEGQAFFAYKRVNAAKANIVFIPSGAIIDYMPPMPKTEITTSN